MKTPHLAISDFIFLEDKPEQADIILVLGGSKPQLMEKACDLYLEGFSPLLLPSGGKNEVIMNYETEWDMFYEIAKVRNVPGEAILKENKARNTFENARFSKEVVNSNNLKIKKAIIVCKAFHARRALLTYQAEFGKDINYLICPVIDERDIKKNNWYKDQDKINRVMSELERIGKYFTSHIINMA